MPKMRPDEQRVYMALRHEFLDSPPARKLASVKKRLEKCRATPELTALIQEYNAQNVATVAKKLLKEGVYHSTLHAKLRFPQLFEVSPAQSAEREASEAEAARNEAESLNSLMGEGKVQEIVEMPSRPELDLANAVDRTKECKLSSSSLYPVYLPLKVQHKLLVEVQRMLEAACFGFGVEQLQCVLKQKDWDCAEAVELSVWTGVLQSREALFTKTQIEDLGKPFGKFLSSVAGIRHTAVHRGRVTANLLKQFLQDAEVLFKLLKNESISLPMAQSRYNTQFSIGEIERNKELLGAKITATQKNFAIQKAELDRLESAAIADMLLEDSEYQELIGERLGHEIDMVGVNHHTILQDEDRTDVETESGVSGREDESGEVSSGSIVHLPDLLAIKN